MRVRIPPALCPPLRSHAAATLRCSRSPPLSLPLGAAPALCNCDGGATAGCAAGGGQRNLESRNRDKFTQNLTTFRHDVKTLLNP